MAKLVGILRSHEDEVMKDVKIISSMGSLALVAKGKKVSNEDSKFDLSDFEVTKEEHALMLSNPKKFIKGTLDDSKIEAGQKTLIWRSQGMKASKDPKRMKKSKRKRSLVIQVTIVTTAMEKTILPKK